MRGVLHLLQGNILSELDAEVLAWNLGDTFIDFRTMTPAQQWERIVTMIHEHDHWEDNWKGEE